MTQFSDLISESRRLEQRASEIQRSKQLGLDDDAIDQIVSDYHAWFARAINALPEEFHERFRDEFEGGTFTSKIKDFLRAPGDKSPFYDEEKPNPLLPSIWSNPFETAFPRSIPKPAPDPRRGPTADRGSRTIEPTPGAA